MWFVSLIIIIFIFIKLLNIDPGVKGKRRKRGNETIQTIVFCIINSSYASLSHLASTSILLNSTLKLLHAFKSHHCDEIYYYIALFNNQDRRLYMCVMEIYNTNSNTMEIYNTNSNTRSISSASFSPQILTDMVTLCLLLDQY